jgi:hypothetical protein
LFALQAPLNNMNEIDKTNPDERAKGDGGATHESRNVQWEEVATTAGLAQAQILAGRLQSEGIPARAWQESIGQSTGLVIGPLGTGYVLVPAAYVEQALAILADVDEDIVEEDE